MAFGASVDVIVLSGIVAVVVDVFKDAVDSELGSVVADVVDTNGAPLEVEVEV